MSTKWPDETAILTRMIRGKNGLPNSTAGPLPNRIFDAEIPLSAGYLKSVQVTDVQNIFGGGRGFFGGQN
jgi:hypothetical protein